jgi:glycosyltransferase involved in cell wall biosynthesis
MAFFMKIIYSHTNDLSIHETSETFVINHALSLANEGVEVELYVINNSNQSGEAIIRKKFNIDRLPETFILKTYPQKGKSKKNFYQTVAANINAQSHCIVITRSHGILKSLLRSRNPANKYFFETHDFFFDLGIRDDTGLLKRWKKHRIEKAYFSRLDGLMHLNQQQKTLYDRYLPGIEKIVLPTGLNTVERHMGQRKDRVVYIGSLNKRLGIDWLINIAKNLSDEVELWVIGGKTDQEIQSFKSNFDGGRLPHNVHITGWIDKQSLSKILNTAKIGLLPLSDTFFNRNLTVPLKMLDYFAFGLPIISSKMPSISSFIEDGQTGYLMDWDHWDGVIRKIENIMKDANHWSKMNETVYGQAEHMKWSTRAQNEISFLKQFN